MATFYLQDGDSTSTIRYLDDVSSIDVGLPKNDFKLRNTLMDGGQIQGVGSLNGREWACSYFFRDNNEYEREAFLDWFTKPSLSKIYLYKSVNRQIKLALTNTSTIAIFLDSTSALAQISTGDAISGVGIPSNTIVEEINTTSIIIDNAATATIPDQTKLVETFNGRARVYPQPSGGESYDDISISDDIKFNLISPSPYFTSTSVTTVSFDSTTNEFSTTLNISGFRTPCTYEFTPNQDFSIFQVKTNESYGFRAARAFKSGETIKVLTTGSDLSMTIHDNDIYGVFSSSSTPFSLERGSNTLLVTATNSTSGALKISYNERQL